MADLPNSHDVVRLLHGLLGRDVSGGVVDTLEPHERACHGLVDNDNRLRYVIGADLPFAHLSGAALAMIPAGAAQGAEPDEDLLEIYHEVANLTSRAVNEASPERVRLDPGIAHDVEVLRSVAASSPGICLDLQIAGYGTGKLGIWQVN